MRFWEVIFMAWNECLTRYDHNHKNVSKMELQGSNSKLLGIIISKTFLTFFYILLQSTKAISQFCHVARWPLGNSIKNWAYWLIFKNLIYKCCFLWKYESYFEQSIMNSKRCYDVHCLKIDISPTEHKYMTYIIVVECHM